MARRPRASRRRHTLGRTTMRRSSVAPFYRDDDPQTHPTINFAATLRHPGLTKVSHPESRDSLRREPQNGPESLCRTKVPRGTKMCASPSRKRGRVGGGGLSRARGVWTAPPPPPPPP